MKVRKWRTSENPHLEGAKRLKQIHVLRCTDVNVEVLRGSRHCRVSWIHESFETTHRSTLPVDSLWRHCVRGKQCKSEVAEYCLAEPLEQRLVQAETRP